MNQYEVEDPLVNVIYYYFYFLVYEPTIKQSFEDVWNRLNPSPPSILNAEVIKIFNFLILI